MHCCALVGTGVTVSLVHCGLLAGGDKARFTDTERRLLRITTVIGEQAIMWAKRTLHVMEGKHINQHEFFVGNIQEHCIIELDLLDGWRVVVDVFDRKLPADFGV